MTTLPPRAQLRAEIVAEWFGSLTAAEVVQKFKRRWSNTFGSMLTDRALFKLWAAAKADGALPGAPRPHFAPKPLACDPIADDEDFDDDEVETAAAPDGAIDVLRQHHASFESAPLNSVSAKFLLLELRRPVEVEGPTPGELRKAAQEYDRLTKDFA